MIASGDFIRIILIVTGVFMLVLTIMSLAKRKMHEAFCFAWCVMSVAVLITGVVLRPVHWQDYFSVKTLILCVIGFYGVLYAAFFVSIRLSDLTKKNQELAIQVSLLNQENERILKRLSELTGKDIREL